MLGWLRRRTVRTQPEARWHVVAEDDAITVTDPRGGAVRAAIADLHAVAVRTTDGGPFATDVWWLLYGSDGRALCGFPLGATGMDAALHRLGRLPGFDHGAMALAMGSTGNAAFVLWRREDSAAAAG